MNDKHKYEAFNNKIVDASDPFKNDYTRCNKDIAENLTKVILSEVKNKPLVISIDAPWGVGKTTFIDMWGQQILKKGGIAIKFDAWKCDFSDNPLLSIVAELNNQLPKIGIKKLNRVIKATKNLVDIAIPATIKLAMSSILSFLKVKEDAKEFLKEVSEGVKDQVIEDIKNYQAECSPLIKFKDELRKASKQETIFLFIDELDRCKPTFAIGVLEIIKHFFDIENICCVISININAFSESVQAYYGYKENTGKSYLERFIDIPIALPEPKHDHFIEHILKNSFALENKEVLLLFIETIKNCSKFGQMSLRIMQKYLRDIKIFLDCNINYDGTNKFPEFYYPCIAYLIAKKRLEEGQLLKALKQEKDFNWRYDFFESTKTPEELSKKLAQLHSRINSFSNKHHLDPEEAKEKNYILLLREQIEKLYGSISQDSVITSKHPISRLPVLKKYRNHFKDAEELVGLLSLIQDIRLEK